MRKYRSMHCWRYLDILHLRILLWSLHNDRFGCGNFNLLCGALAQLSILDMVRTTKDSIHLFKADVLCLCDEEPYVRKQYHIDGTEHVHGVEAFVGQEHRKCLLQADIGDILKLRRDGNSLVTNVHREDFACPYPDCCAPRWLEEEREEKHEEDCGDANATCLTLAQSSGSFCDDRGCDQHAHCHTYSTSKEQESATESVNRPGCIESEDNAEGAVQCIDKLDRVIVSKYRLVYLG